MITRFCVVLACGLAVATLQAADAVKPDCIFITSKASLIHIGSLDSFDITEGGKEAARLILDWIKTGNTNSAAQAIAVYKRIIPNENFGGEYTALQWFCEYALAPAGQQKAMLREPLVNEFYKFFSATNFTRLKTYLLHKYHLASKDEKIDRHEMRFLEDFILFNNPRRESWEKSSKIMEVLPLKAGDAVADIGCGPGYYTVKFSKVVGPRGRVYASEINPLHCEYMTNLVHNLHLENVEVIHSRKDEVGLSQPPPPNLSSPGPQPLTNGLSRPPRPPPQTNGFGFSNQVDLIFLCSLYHILYVETEENLVGLLESAKKSLKPDGTLVIIDNALVQDSDLPYHGPFIAKELIIAQLKHFGFHLAAVHQFIPQRYVLLFKKAEALPDLAKGKNEPPAPGCIEIKSGKSLLRLQAFMPSEKARLAAQNFLEGLEKKDQAKIHLARKQFTELVPIENYGGEYLSMQWFTDYLLAPTEQRPAFLTNGLVSDYFHFFADNDWAVLKEFLKRRHHLAKFPDMETSEGDDRMGFLMDVIFFNNPRREQWEKTSLLIKALDLKPGQSVADVGCGTGYYTFQFANLVGPKGRVFAIETNDKHVSYIADYARRNRVSNVLPVKSKLNDICVDQKLDVAFLCSLYPMVYATSMEKVKDEFIESIKKALKPDGRLVIVDNDVVEDPAILPYHASCMDRRLIITQLKYYGFHLVQTHQFIPQRYMLVFRKS